MKQSHALEILHSGASVYLTGAPGAGKTYVLNEFVTQARRAGLSVAVTASTGIASTHINGQTIHSFSGVGVSQYLTEDLMKRIMTRRKKTIANVDILVIDEVSMIHAWLFDMVDEVCRRARKNSLPFGGMQVVISGDFFQLPPVSTAHSHADVLGMSEEALAVQARYAEHGKNMNGFVTQSFAWQALNPVICYITEQHRQDDGQLLDVLTHVRHNAVTADDCGVLAGRIGVKPFENEVFTHLFPTNAQADTLNDRQLSQLDEDEHVYVSRSSGSATLVDRLKKSMLAPQELVLKKGASVMALRNDSDKQYVNGSLGVVVGFSPKSRGGYPIVEFDNGHVVTMKPADWEITDAEEVLAVVSQVPLRCAWAITIHKSQGMTLDRAVMDLRRTFTPGMGYVALSRVQSLNGLYLEGITDKALQVSWDASLLDGQLRGLSDEAEKRLVSVGVQGVKDMFGMMSLDDDDDEFSQGNLF